MTGFLGRPSTDTTNDTRKDWHQFDSLSWELDPKGDYSHGTIRRAAGRRNAGRGTAE
jgi:hypothetical protein